MNVMRWMRWDEWNEMWWDEWNEMWWDNKMNVMRWMDKMDEMRWMDKVNVMNVMNETNGWDEFSEMRFPEFNPFPILPLESTHHYCMDMVWGSQMDTLVHTLHSLLIVNFWTRAVWKRWIIFDVFTPPYSTEQYKTVHVHTQSLTPYSIHSL